MWCFVGDDNDAAQAAIAPMLEAAEPLLHGAGPMPYAGLQGFFDQLYPKGMQGYWRADFVNELSDAAIAAHREHAELMTPGASTMHMYPIDGAVHDVGESDTAWANRDVQWAEVISGPTPTRRAATRSGSGRSTTSTPPTRTRRPAGPTSTS